jgi:tellurite resistance protein TerC
METAGTVGLRAAIVAVMLAIDLFMVGGGNERRVSFREAATWSVVWIAITLAFAGAWLIIQFHWILYIFGAFLRVTGIKIY